MHEKKSEPPTLTAVIPIYNGEKNIRETLDNILQINYQPLELILVDDGSSDNSGMICREYEAMDKRIRYIRQENQGIAASRNKGLDLAKGEYICFWDQDDIVIAKGLFALLEKMKMESAQMGMCAARRLTGGNTSDYERMQDGVFQGRNVQEKLLYPLLFRGYQYDFVNSESYFYGTVWKCIFQTDLMRDNGIRFQSFIHYEDDWLVVTKALCNTHKAVTVSEAGYCWRVDEASESHQSIYIENLPQRFAAFDKYVLTYLQQGIRDTDIMNEYRKVNLCEHYLELYRNARSAKGPASRQKSHKNLKQYLIETDYKRQLSCGKKLKKTAYRRQVVLKSLRYGGISITYLISQIFDWMEFWTGRVRWIANLERRYKLE